MILAIIILVYLIISFLTFKKWVCKWNNTEFEKVMFSLIWPLILPLYGVRKIQEKM